MMPPHDISVIVPRDAARGAALDALGRAAAGGDRDAEARALEGLYPLLFRIITSGAQRAYHRERLLARLDDLIAEAFVDAVKAIRRYKGRCRLTSWVGNVVAQQQKGHRRDYSVGAPIRLPARTCDRYDSQVSAALAQPLSLSLRYGDDEPGEEWLIAHVAEQAQLAVDRDRRQETWRLLGQLKPRHRYVLHRLFGLDGHRAATLETVGHALGRSRQRILQIRDAALARLREIATHD